MKTEFDIQLTADDVWIYNLYQNYLGSAGGVISIIISLLIASLAVRSAGNGQYGFTVLYAVVAVIVLLYTPISLRGKARIAIATDEAIAGSMHYEMTEKKIRVSQKGQEAELSWGSVAKAVEFKNLILIYNSVNNAYIIPKEQVKAQYNDIRMLAINALPPERCRIR